MIHRRIKSPETGFDGAVSTRLHRNRVKSEVHKPHCINKQIKILHNAEQKQEEVLRKCRFMCVSFAAVLRRQMPGKGFCCPSEIKN